MEKELTFPTHRLIVETLPFTSYVRVTNYVSGQPYQDMVDAILMKRSLRMSFVKYERILLNNYFRSLLSFHHINTVNYSYNYPRFEVFQQEIDYYQFCVEHRIPFEEQKWFKTAYIKATFEETITYLNNASVSLINTLYPEYIPQVSFKFVDYTKLHKEIPNIYKYNPEKYQQFLKDNGITCLYHFTDRRNIQSIKENGLCSINYLKQKSISAHFASSSGSRELDSYHQISNYVHLSYERKNPMLFIALAEGRLSDYVILQVPTDVMFWKGTKYTQCNAAKNGAVFSDDIDFVLDIPFKKFHNSRYDKNSPYRNYFMSEVLVYEKIPYEIIKELNQL